jgi:hypothetical protein
VQPLTLEENQFIFFESIFVGKTLTLNPNPGGGRRP